MTEPLIQVITPVYNGAAFIGGAIASIQAQTYKNVKITLVDDGSEDDTVNIIEACAKTDNRISLIKQRHMGVQFALNAGLRITTADYVAFLDADDLWHPQKLEKQIQYLTAGGFEMCFCLMQEFQDSSTVSQLNRHRARANAMKGYSKSACLVRRTAFDKYGLFNEDVAIGDFVEWFSRVLRGNGTVKIIDETLAFRRVHNNNTMLNADKSSFLRILKAHLDERRNNGET